MGDSINTNAAVQHHYNSEELLNRPGGIRVDSIGLRASLTSILAGASQR